jgi:hypothetical protein
LERVLLTTIIHLGPTLDLLRRRVKQKEGRKGGDGGNHDLSTEAHVSDERQTVEQSANISTNELPLGTTNR